MKRSILILAAATLAYSSFAQVTGKDSLKSSAPLPVNDAVFSDKNIPAYFIPIDRTTTIVSPEPIVYVDISTNKVEGDLSANAGNKVFRLKPIKDFPENESFTITIVTEKMVAIYKLTCRFSDSLNDNVYTIAVNPATAWQLNEYNKPAAADFQKLSFYALTKKRSVLNITSKENGMEGWVNNIYTAGEYIILDMGIKNKTHLPFDIDKISFKLLDKYQLAAHIAQELEIHYCFEFYGKENSTIKKSWRNLYIFPKFTYPDNKVLQIEVNERPISGRKLTINIDYNQLLRADILQ